MNNEAKERRAKNFLEEEKSLLLDIIEKCVDIIENRNHTSNSIALKRKTWNLITNLFNARNGYQRDGWQLRHLYSNMKKRLTKDLEERKLHKMSQSDLRLLNIMSTKIEGELKPNEIFEEIKNIEIVISDSETPDALQEIEVQSIPIPSISPIENESSKPIEHSIVLHAKDTLYYVQL